MRCRTAFLVEKRNGSTELLAAPKLARSLQRALATARPTGPGVAVALARAVLDSVQSRRRGGRPLRTADISVAARAVLRAAGHDAAAHAFERAAGERRARATLWRELANATHPARTGALAARGSVPRPPDGLGGVPGSLGRVEDR